MNRILFSTKKICRRAAAGMISVIRRCGREKTELTAASWGTALRMGADRSCCLPARMDSTGISRVCLRSITIVSERCGSVPDFFELDGKWVLLTSPQDMLPEGFEYHNGNGTLCLIGEYDEEKGTFTNSMIRAIDYGIDFYAPQTVLTPDGRRVMIGWMQNWDACSLRSPEEKWFGQMSLPRELFIKDGRLYQRR